MIVTNGSAVTVSVRVALPVPPLLVALSEIALVPVALGIPEINPVCVFNARFAGKPVAP